MGIRSAIYSWLRSGAPKPRQRGYQGASVSRLTADWITSSTSVDSEIKSSFKTLRNRARQLVRDNDFARQALRSVQNNVIGQGIKMQPQIKMQRGGKLDEALNEQIHEKWEEWSRKQSCHTAGMLCFSDIERLAIRSICESGEVFIRLVRQPFGGGKLPFALEILESDYLVDDEMPQPANGNMVRMGVEVDRWGRPAAYHFYQSHPGDQFVGANRQNMRRIRVPAADVLHLFITERPGQTRGVSWFSSAIQRLHHLAGYEEAEVIRARASSSLMGFISSPEGELHGDEIYNGERVSNFEPGVFKYLQPGETVSVPSLDAPDGQFEPFVRSMLRAVAAGVGCSFESVSKDFTQTNYSSSRLSLLEERDTWRVLQKFMIENFHQPIYEAWLEMAVMSGELPIQGYEISPDRFRKIQWMPRGWSWVDPQKEVEAYKTAVRCGFKTLASVISEQGGDLEDLLLQRQAELAKFDELGIVLDTDPTQVNDAGAQQVPPLVETPTPTEYDSEDEVIE